MDDVALAIKRAVERVKRVNPPTGYLIIGANKELWFELLHFPDYVEPDEDGKYRYGGITLWIVPPMEAAPVAMVGGARKSGEAYWRKAQRKRGK